MSSESRKTSYTKLGNQQIDSLHEDFLEMLDQTNNAESGEFPSAFNNLLTHLEMHFSQEEELMKQFQDPGYVDHCAHHQTIIGELHQFKKRVEMGRSSFAKAYLKGKLPDWFNLHSTTMDAALISHLKKDQA